MTVQKVTEKESPDFLIERGPDDRVKLRWTVDMGAVDSYNYRHFMEYLDALKGTEYIKTKRYSASIEIADHVIETQEYMKQLKAHIEAFPSTLRRLIVQIV